MIKCFSEGSQHSIRVIVFMLAVTFVCVACEGQKPEKTLQVAAQGLISGALAENTGFAVLGSIQHGGSFWNTTSGERQYNWNHRAGEFSSLRAVGLAGNGKVAVTVEDKDIVVWDMSTGQSLQFWQAPDRVMAIAVGQHGQYAILGLQNRQAVYFDIRQGSAVYEFQHDAEVFAVSLSRNGEFAMTGSDDRTARIWRLDDGALLHKFDHGNQVRAVALSEDGAQAFSAAQREEAVVWDSNSGSARTRLDFRYENFTAARFIEGGSKLLLGTFRGGVYLVSSSSGEKLKHWTAKPRQLFGPASSAAILDVAADSSGKVVALSSDGLVQYFSP